jgi:ABC-2 type transport system permease protein
VLYFPAKTAVRWDEIQLLPILLIQLGWLVILAALVAFMYGRGVQKLNVNGG